MILICQKDLSYGQMPRLTAKQAKEADLDPKAYHGGPVQRYEAGQEYEVERRLAVRLLRDFGPARGRSDVRFTPKNPADYFAVLAGSGQAEKVTLGDAMERGFITPEGGQIEQTVEVSA